jgi:hypothetical protein
VLFPEASVIEGHPTMSMPVFLSGEKRQAVYTSMIIPPVKRVEKVNGEINQVRLRNYLYVTPKLYHTTKLTLPRSTYFIDLSRDLDDGAVSLLINNGLKDRFPAACDAWKLNNIKSKETTEKAIVEKKRQVDEDLRNSKSQLEDTLSREITRRIMEAYPYVLPTQFCL